VRGSKGNKVLRTRKIKLHPEYINMYSYFCSNQCYNDFANANIEQIIAIAPRTEPLETPIENPERTKHETSWGYTYYNTKIRERVQQIIESEEWEVWQYWQWCMVQDSGIMHLLTKRRNMSTETIKALREIFEILKLSKEYVDLLEKRVAILEKQLQEK